MDSAVGCRLRESLASLLIALEDSCVSCLVAGECLYPAAFTLGRVKVIPVKVAAADRPLLFVYRHRGCSVIMSRVIDAVLSDSPEDEMGCLRPAADLGTVGLKAVYSLYKPTIHKSGRCHSLLKKKSDASNREICSQNETREEAIRWRLSRGRDHRIEMNDTLVEEGSGCACPVVSVAPLKTVFVNLTQSSWWYPSLFG